MNRSRCNHIIAIAMALILALSTGLFSTVAFASTAKFDSSIVEVLADGTYKVTTVFSLQGTTTDVNVVIHEWARGKNADATSLVYPIDVVNVSGNTLTLTFYDNQRDTSFEGYTVHFTLQFPNTLDMSYNVETIFIPEVTIDNVFYDNQTGYSAISFSSNRDGVVSVIDTNAVNTSNGLLDGTTTGPLSANVSYSFRVIESDTYVIKVSHTRTNETYIMNKTVNITNEAPEARNVQISYDNLQIGSTLTGDYTFFDVEGDLEGNSLYQWYYYENGN